MKSRATNAGLPHHMRIAALQCNFERGWKQTMRVPSLWNRFGFNVEQLYHVYADGYSLVHSGGKARERLREYLAASRRKGLQVILYVNCHILMGPEVRRHAGWAQVDCKGKYHRPYGTYYAPCLNSPWREYFLHMLAGLKGLDLAGIFFDGPSRGTCFCRHCRKRFRKETGRSLLASAGDAADAFAAQVFKEFCGAIHGAVKETDRSWISYINFDVMNPDADAAEMDALSQTNDIIGTEGGFFFYGAPAQADPWRPAVTAKMCEAVARGKPTVIFMAGDHKPWSWYLHTPAETTLCYASALANNASLWYGIHGPTRLLDSPSGRAARDIIRFDRRHDRLYQRTESMADVAVFFSFDTHRHYRKTSAETDLYRSAANGPADVIGNYTASFRGATAMLARSGMPFDVVTELNLSSLARYAVLVLPTMACVAERTAGVLREFVRRGGTILADSEWSLYDGGLRHLDNFRLADLAGAQFRGYRTYQSHDYFVFEPAARPDRGATLVPAPLAAVDVTPHRGTSVLARLCEPLPGRYWGAPSKPAHPFILRNRVGKGTVYFIAGTFFELYGVYGIEDYRWFVADLLGRHAAPPVVVHCQPGLVEVTARRSLSGNGTMLIHLVNYTGAMTRPIEQVVPLRNVELRVRTGAAAVRSLTSGKSLPVRSGRVVLPELREFEVLAVDMP